MAVGDKNSNSISVETILNRFFVTRQVQLFSHITWFIKLFGRERQKYNYYLHTCKAACVFGFVLYLSVFGVPAVVSATTAATPKSGKTTVTHQQTCPRNPCINEILFPPELQP